MTPPIRARLGDQLEAQIAQACSTNTSAGLRALLLLGLGAAGVDMRPFQREIRRTLAEDLKPSVDRALRQLLDGSDRPAVLDQLFIPAAPPLETLEQPAGDPLLGVGFDF